MSDENEEQPQGLPMFVLGGKPPTPEEVLEHRKRVANFAKAALPSLNAIRRAARDLNTLYGDAPVRHDDLARRLWLVRENVAVMLEQMEGLAEQ